MEEWGTKASKKFAFFIWCTVRDAILIVDNLKRRRMVMSWRCLCKEAKKSPTRFCYIANSFDIGGILHVID